MSTRVANPSVIEEQMPVVGSDDGQFAMVDRLDPGNTINLIKDDQGQHQWIPTD